MNTQVVELYRTDYTTCIINLHGATVTSWRVRNIEKLFMSRTAIFDNRSPILGGIPIIFPVYGNWDFGPEHGFARLMRWKIEKEPKRYPNNDVEVVLSLREDAHTKSMWNYQFFILYTITLKENELHLRFSVENVSPVSLLKFNLVLQNHFRIPLNDCIIHGLINCEYIDRLEDVKKMKIDYKTQIKIEKPIDRVYINTEPELRLINDNSYWEMKLLKTNFLDSTIWNPMIKHEDNPNLQFDEDEFGKMICFGSGTAYKNIVIHPGQIYEALQVLQIMCDYTN